MKTHKTIKILALILAILAAVIFTLSFIPGNVKGSSILDDIIERFTPGEVGRKMKEIREDDSDIVIAEVNGEKILKKDLDFVKYANQVYLSSDDMKNPPLPSIPMLTDEEIIKTLIADKIMIQKMKEKGAVFPYEEKLKELKDNQKKLEERLKAKEEFHAKNEISNSELIEYIELFEHIELETIEELRERLKADEEFFAGLGLTADEYFETIGIETEMKVFYSMEYFKYFYSEIFPNLEIKGGTIEETMQIFQDHKNSLLEEADYKIYYENLTR